MSRKIVVKIKSTGPQGPKGLPGAAGGIFLDLGDTPSSYIGQAGKTVIVNLTENGLEFGVAAGAGDMEASVYDPTSVVGDVFDMDNMVEGLTNLILTQAERDEFHTNHANRAALDLVSGTNTGDQTLPVAGDFNHDDLANITGTPAQYNHPTNAQMSNLHTDHANRAALDAVSGTNTGDQVSGDFSHDSLSGLTGTAGQYNHPTNAQIGNIHAPGSDDQVAGDFNHDDLASITGTPGEYNHPNDSQMSNLHTNHANRAALDLVSGTNTGDQDLSGLQGEITLTTIGTSGAATLINDTLNIPQYAGGGGDVSKVGTPVNNELAVWTGDGTLEGEPDLTYDGATLAVVGTVTSNGTTLTGDQDLSSYVTAAAVIADNTITRGDGGARGVQGSGSYITDSDQLGLGLVPSHKIHARAATGGCTQFLDHTATDGFADVNFSEAGVYKGGMSFIGSAFSDVNWRNKVIISAASDNEGAFIFRTKTATAYNEVMTLNNIGELDVAGDVTANGITLTGDQDLSGYTTESDVVALVIALG